MKLRVEYWWSDIDRGKQTYSEENRYQNHFFHHKDRVGIETRLLGYWPEIEDHSHDRAFRILQHIDSVLFCDR